MVTCSVSGLCPAAPQQSTGERQMESLGQQDEPAAQTDFGKIWFFHKQNVVNDEMIFFFLQRLYRR